jgi:GT2 family glycosyltransferase
VDVIDEGAAVVGVPCRIQPGDSTTTARAIAIAVSHSFGIGDAKYRLTNGAGQEDVDTVAFACFRKSLWTELHGFDETLLTNEDYDFNYRAKVRGGRVLLDRSEYCDYFARPTLTDLAKQYLRYGQWKARMILTRPASIKLRHVVAPAFVASIFIFAAIGLWQRAFWAILGLEAALYLLASIFFSARAARQMGAGIRVMAMLPLVFFTIHFCWGSSFLRGLLQRPR